MAEFQFGVKKQYGFVSTGYETLTSNFEFVTITTAVPILTYAQFIAKSVDPAAPTPTEVTNANASQAALDKLIQIVSLRGQPVIMGMVTGAGTAPATVAPFVIKLAIEHAYAWQSTATAASAPTYASTGVLTTVDPRAGEDLKARFIADGVNYGFGANVGGVNDTGVLAIVFNSTLA